MAIGAENISVRVSGLTASIADSEHVHFMYGLDGDPEPDHHWHAVSGVRCCVRRADPGFGQAVIIPPALGLFWTPYADWIYTVVSLSGVLLICWLVLGRSSP